MVTKLHAHNLFSTLLTDDHDAAAAIGSKTSDTWVRLLKVAVGAGFNQFQGSMDRSFEQANKDSVRNIMLGHEQIFKQQVHELHRLYRVQKMLMAELKNKEVKLQSLSNMTPTAITDTKSRFWSSASTSETSHSSYVNCKEDVNCKEGCTGKPNSDCSSLHPCNTKEEASRTKNIFDLELPAEYDTTRDERPIQGQTINFQELSKDITGIGSPDLWTEEENELELTLSIGRGLSEKKKSRHWLSQDIDLICPKIAPKEIRPERREEYNNPSACFNRESLQRPPWLFHALSFSRT